MRMRKKEWARPELAACPYYVKEPSAMRGQWRSFFKKDQPIFLDLGCGKCEFLRKAAHRHPEVNFIGIDQSDDVLGVGRRLIEETYGQAPVDNIALFAGNIEQLARFFDPEKEKCARIYINFCNPWPKARHHKRRLTHTQQLEKYRELLEENGEIWFKTDNDDLFLATLRYMKEAGFAVYRSTRDLHGENDPENAWSEHEILFSRQGIPIKALKARMAERPQKEPADASPAEETSPAEREEEE